jgi:hypothetical protein
MLMFSVSLPRDPGNSEKNGVASWKVQSWKPEVFHQVDHTLAHQWFSTGDPDLVDPRFTASAARRRISS